ncbi:hypothetical protein [Deinococcus sp. UYEF24]
MRKNVIVALATLAFAGASAVNNPALKPSFADLTWYSQKDYVKRTLTAKGYNYIGDGGKFLDMQFSGKPNGINATIVVSFNDKNQLVKTNLIFSGLSAVSIYDTVKEALTSKYGSGVSSEITYLPKYDTLLSSYITAAKKHQTIWEFPTRNYGVWLQIAKPYVNREDYNAMLSYESPAWSAELERRNNNSDF